MGIADDPGDAGEGGEFIGGALGVAAGDDDAGGGVGGVEFADGVASLGIGCGCYGAGVDDDDVGACGFERGSEAAIEELAFEGGAVSLGGAAAELFDVERGHWPHISTATNRTGQRVRREEKTEIKQDIQP